MKLRRFIPHRHPRPERVQLQSQLASGVRPPNFPLFFSSFAELFRVQTPHSQLRPSVDRERRRVPAAAGQQPAPRGDSPSQHTPEQRPALAPLAPSLEQSRGGPRSAEAFPRRRHQLLLETFPKRAIGQRGERRVGESLAAPVSGGAHPVPRRKRPASAMGESERPSALELNSLGGAQTSLLLCEPSRLRQSHRGYEPPHRVLQT
mmetsp:Transcript_11055/g.51187  ORF Transcript_11055/g.51187 Transcript_11055/m.51187 type:complete len:205 (+) Transcript_11055:362-976(+)